MLNLEAGEWISKPERVLSTDKVNIRAFIKINDEIMEGIGHGSATFKVSNKLSLLCCLYASVS